MFRSYQNLILFFNGIHIIEIIWKKGRAMQR